MSFRTGKVASVDMGSVESSRVVVRREEFVFVFMVVLSVVSRVVLSVVSRVVFHIVLRVVETATIY